MIKIKYFVGEEQFQIERYKLTFKGKKTLFPLGLEPRTSRVCSERDNHYTMETSDGKVDRYQSWTDDASCCVSAHATRHWYNKYIYTSEFQDFPQQKIPWN